MSFANIRDKNDYSALVWNAVQNSYERGDYLDVVRQVLDYGRCLGYLMWTQQKNVEEYLLTLEEYYNEKFN